jgi:hypothetical protein
MTSSQWQDEENEAQILNKFQHAIANALDEVFGDGLHYDDLLEKRFSQKHGSPYGAASDIRDVLYRTTSRREMALALEHLIDAASTIPKQYGAWKTTLDQVVGAIDDAFKNQPSIKLKLVLVGDSYEIRAAGPPEIEDAIVEPAIDWLARFPAVQEHARKALRSLAKEEFKESLDAARLALETLAKAVTGVDKSLEKQIAGDAPLLKWMREKGMKPQAVTMAQRITLSFCDLQNAWVKHQPVAGSSFGSAEAEYGVYVTLCLIRLISQISP